MRVIWANDELTDDEERANGDHFGTGM